MKNRVFERWEDIRKAAPGFAGRRLKHARQLRYGWAHPRQAVFVFGCQRSGTKMLMRAFDRCPSIRIYHENHASAFHDFRLRSDRVLRLLIAANPAPTVLFKPICDSHLAAGILDRFPDSRAVWIYRHPDDVANSAVQKWGEHQRDVVEAVVAGDASRWGWRAEGIPQEEVALLRSVHRPELSAHEGALLFWHVRNAFFFSQGLDRHPRVRLVRYEDLALSPATAFPPIFAHVGAPFDPSWIGAVRSASVRKREPPAASASIRGLCADLLDRLDRSRPCPSPA